MVVRIRSLNIKYLKTIHGDLLDMDDTVGAIFDDRADFPDRLSGKEVLPTSIVQIFRYPPDPTEIANVQRYGSLMPESSARPRKRPLVVSSPSEGRYPRTSIEGLDDGQLSSAQNKRPRTHGTSVNNSLGLDRTPPRPVEESGTQGSIHQVNDSQRSPLNKRRASFILMIP